MGQIIAWGRFWGIYCTVEFKERNLFPAGYALYVCGCGLAGNSGLIEGPRNRGEGSDLFGEDTVAGQDAVFC